MTPAIGTSVSKLSWTLCFCFFSVLFNVFIYFCLSLDNKPRRLTFKKNWKTWEWKARFTRVLKSDLLIANFFVKAEPIESGWKLVGLNRGARDKIWLSQSPLAIEIIFILYRKNVVCWKNTKSCGYSPRGLIIYQK